MRGWVVWIAGLTAALLAVGLLAAPAMARPAHARARAPRCCRVPAGAVVQVELADPVSTRVQKTGDRFALKLAAPLVVDGRVVLRAGAPGEGVVIEATKPGLGGKPAKLVLAARYLILRHGRLPLEGLQLSGGGHSNAAAAQAVGLTGIVFAPLGFVGLAVQGGEVTFPAGTTATARVSAPMTLPSLGRASAAAVAAQAAASAGPIQDGAIAIPPPPPGQGQVVFFRRKSLLGTGQWFKVREDGRALGKLSNGAYFVQVTRPGLHTYTATEEPEFKDKLKLEVAPGETYYVEGALTKGVILGAADLTPSSAASFAKASKDLKLAAAPEPEPQEDQAADVGLEQDSASQQAQTQQAQTQQAQAQPAQAQPAQGLGAGYQWAQEKGIGTAAGCPPEPDPNRAGCLAYVRDEAGRAPR